MRRCHACGAEIGTAEKILRTDECPGCARDLHSCRNCRHYHPSAHNQCLEPVAEWVTEKDRANFCDYFSFAESSAAAPSSPKKPPEEEARERWKKLFKS